MEPVRPSLLPDPSLDREGMLAVQDRVRALARFEHDGGDPLGGDALVAGIDTAFVDGEAVSAVVAVRDDETIEEVYTRTALEFPYIPGLLAFREAGPVLETLSALACTPDVLLCDGNGRIHQRQAGIATHLGVLCDVPAVGVAKSLLCGRLEGGPEPPYPAGTRVPIVADERVDAPDGTLLGYAVQTRQWADREPAINPVYVSPGHRIDAAAAADLAVETCAGYKLPEPIRLADRLAAEAAG